MSNLPNKRMQVDGRTGRGRDGEKQTLVRARKDRNLWSAMIVHILKADGI